MFPNVKRLLFSMFGFFYSSVVIIGASTIEYIAKFAYLLLKFIIKGVPQLLLGLAYGYTVYCIGCAAAALVIGFQTGTSTIPLLLSVCSPAALLSSLSLLSPLIPFLPFVAISLPLIYVGVGVVDMLTSCLWHSVMDFYDKGLKEGLRSPFKYYVAIFQCKYHGNTDNLQHCLEERAITTKIEILETVAHHFSHSISSILKQLVPEALTTIITEYAFTAASLASFIPRDFTSNHYTNGRQNMTINMEDKLCRAYHIRRDDNSILKPYRLFYNYNNTKEISAVFKCDLFLKSLHNSTESFATMLKFSRKFNTPTLVRTKINSLFFICGDENGHGDWKWTEIKFSSPEEKALLESLPFKDGIIKRNNTQFSQVVNIVKKGHPNIEVGGDVSRQFRCARLASLH